MLINVRMPTLVGIPTFLSMIKFESKKCLYFSTFYFLRAVEISRSVELSTKIFITSELGHAVLSI